MIRRWVHHLLDILNGEKESDAFDWIVLILSCVTLLYVLGHLAVAIGRWIGG